MTDEQIRVLDAMGNGEMARLLDQICSDTGLSRAIVRSTCKSLVTLGYAEFTSLVNDEGYLAGRGYWRNGKGDDYLKELFNDPAQWQ